MTKTKKETQWWGTRKWHKTISTVRLPASTGPWQHLFSSVYLSLHAGVQVCTHHQLMLIAQSKSHKDPTSIASVPLPASTSHLLFFFFRGKDFIILGSCISVLLRMRRKESLCKSMSNTVELIPWSLGGHFSHPHGLRFKRLSAKELRLVIPVTE